MSWSEYKDQKPVFPPEVPRPKSRKNTRQWCKGKAGRHHDAVPVQIHHYGVNRPCGPMPSWCAPLGWPDWSCRHWMVCTLCGKHLRKVPSAACPDRFPVLNLVDRDA